ncbi:Carboxypeptidase S1 [Psilocybe cubensis]|uniref:Carboxypeptidase S1 n=2 Tax=Psilocybe cubensis TaxID=181762 RepID=A0ACB8GYL8_PSICU|nr:Carboxypeptidase S1 [Psilocybe cubensis]KAH9480109.1 Carboxypeptidase S1 [Psilocybe cubensis]
MQLKLAVIAAILYITSATRGGQVPVVGGVIGGVPSPIRTTKEFIASPQTIRNVTTPGKLRVVENSGVCETTPGIYQASGYGDLTSTESIWFWFFASRKNPENAPLALWFNGGPGSSSMIGLFQEHGPCRITNDSSSVTHNPFSWNNEANVLYIDQPVGVGFSYGDTKVGTSQEAAADVWSFLQIFLSDKRFSHLKANKLALWTESYGGHYGPTFAAHFIKQNMAIQQGKISGTVLNLQVLGIGNGITNPLVQYPGYLEYAAFNPYHYPLVDDAVLDMANQSWTTPVTGCRDLIIECNGPNGTNFICSEAQGFCNGNILSPLAGNFDVYYVPVENPDPYPPPFDEYINKVASAIGGEVTWIQSSDDVYINFATTGDWMRDSSPDLEFVINSGVRTIIYDGDADYILNFNGVEAMVNNLKTIWSPIYKTQKFKPYSVHGTQTGIYKNAGKFSYVRIFGAGHEVPAYKFGNLDYGEAAAQMFTQIMRDECLSST